MNLTASIEEPRFDEMQAVGLTPAASRLVRPPRVAESPVSLECRYQQTVMLAGTQPDQSSNVVIGDVVGIHIDDSVLVDGLVDTYGVSLRRS